MTDPSETRVQPGNQSDLPEAAVRRLESGAFSSGLTVPDFAACLELGLEPVALVQGFCVMRWGFYSAGMGMGGYLRGASPYAWGAQGPSGYSEVFRCPHGFVSAEHRMWGQNLEQPWVEQAWMQGYGTAYNRMIEEATTMNAHGVIGVVDRVAHLADTGTTEFHFLGTAVRAEGVKQPAKAPPWSTFLAGQRLTKEIEAGYMPVCVAATLASIRVWAYCMTEYLMEGQTGWSWGGVGSMEVDQVSRAHMAARQLARTQIRQQLGTDALHGARIHVQRRELAQGDEVIDCTMRGNRVRRFKDFDPVPLPGPTVRLS